MGDGRDEPLFAVLSESGTEAVLGAAEASLYLWFLPGRKGGGVGFGRTVKWSAAARALVPSGTNVVGSEGVGIGEGSG